MVSAQTQPKYEIKGQPLVDVPEIFQLGKDDGGLGRDAVRVMGERFGDHRYLRVSAPKNQPVQGSNSYIRFALGPIARELYRDNIRLLTPALSELALRDGKLPNAHSTYEDLGVVVCSLEGANQQLARHLVEQARERGIEIEFPMVFYGLKTAKDGEFPDGLRLDLDDIAVGYHVPILKSRTSKFKSDDKGLVKTGFPEEIGEGERTLYTAQDGLRRLYRDGGLNFYAGVDSLPGSVEAGRVSFVKGEAPQNLEARLAELHAERDRQIAEARYGKALQIMGR